MLVRRGMKDGKGLALLHHLEHPPPVPNVPDHWNEFECGMCGEELGTDVEDGILAVS